jgi:hypothetical protein
VQWEAGYCSSAGVNVCKYHAEFALEYVWQLLASELLLLFM